MFCRSQLSQISVYWERKFSLLHLTSLKNVLTSPLKYPAVSCVSQWSLTQLDKVPASQNHSVVWNRSLWRFSSSRISAYWSKITCTFVSLKIINGFTLAGSNSGLLCVSSLRAGHRHVVKKYLFVLFPLTAEKCPNVSWKKHPVVSRSQVLRRCLEQRSLAWSIFASFTWLFGSNALISVFPAAVG